MKITDIEFGKGKSYMDSNGVIWNAGQLELYTKTGYTITRQYNLKNILSMDFEEQVDWSKVEVDTPILVSDNGEYWYQRHFAKFENGKIYAFHDGKTSWTTEATIPWNYAKLPERENR